VQSALLAAGIARDLATNHASLSQILRGRRDVSAHIAHELGRRAGLRAQEIARCCEAQTDHSVVRVITSRAFRPGSALDRNSHWNSNRRGELLARSVAATRSTRHGVAAPLEKTHLIMPNPVVRWQMLSLQPEKVAEFYQKLFSWKTSRANALGYREMLGGVPSSIDGGVWPAPPESTTFVQLFVEVEDVDSSIAKAEKLGAKVLVPKSVLPDGDTMAVLQDPTGMSFGICRLRSPSA